jgi:hypothetical protein
MTEPPVRTKYRLQPKLRNTNKEADVSNHGNGRLPTRECHSPAPRIANAIKIKELAQWGTRYGWLEISEYTGSLQIGAYSYSNLLPRQPTSQETPFFTANFEGLA